eukprot:CAMPEP_0206511040 /NCGR_PEP_ID=MMETSP0324_2-20121206/60057_1 /ASSEMBLY_ACC=CAM_ASM_000836 /TAXON_ID=2866 /ORGANISM="Crypthecodinium cohnii, Strain Seligo" /LENGTH=174 /DNA_ID=CAMNT_0054002751 /DNA_START=467 /DNA_END=988 /DNA_ORIENTATION=-
MKKELLERAKRAKAKASEEGTITIDEKFDSKTKEMGLIVDVHELAVEVLEARKEKRRQRRYLERLNQNLARYGPIRLLQRPFRYAMCRRAMVSTKKARAAAQAPAPRASQPPSVQDAVKPLSEGFQGHPVRAGWLIGLASFGFRAGSRALAENAGEPRPNGGRAGWHRGRTRKG